MPILVDDGAAAAAAAAAEEETTYNREPSEHSPRDSKSHHFQSVLSSSVFPITLQFVDVFYRVRMEKKSKGRLRMMFTEGPTSSASPEGRKTPLQPDRERTILNGVTGMVSPGEIMAVMGPSGSGKSTLLNALAGRLHGHGLAGKILANGRNLCKKVLRRTGFVTQDDVLYPNLTVRETLIYCALLRLPNTLSRNEKIAMAGSVIAELGLEKCEDTIIGNSFVRGVSGGERKRVSIAHEMLVNPSLLVLDEPASGLDSTAAYRLVSTLRLLAEKGKTILTSVHQPSSRLFQMFETVLVLSSEGSCIYFGKANEVLGYFCSIGFSPSFPMNPADFLLDLANGVFPVDVATERERSSAMQFLVSSYDNVVAPNVRAACMDKANSFPKEAMLLKDQGRGSTWRTNFSTWLTQFSILLQRNLKQRRHETFDSLRVFQVIAASLLAGSMWWRSDFWDVGDRLGLLFFFAIFWGVFPSFNAVFAFPQERAIFVKERASGMYTLSSYFMARISGDLPMELILPTVFLTIAYWMAGLKPELGAFLLTLLVLLCYVLVSQGLGLVLGALIMDAKQASTMVTVTMLAFVLTGGFYVHKMPSLLGWTKYISTTFYCYRLLIDVQYGEGKGWASSVPACSRNGIGVVNCGLIEENIKNQIQPATSVAIMLLMFFGFRLMAYVALRRIKS